MAQIYDPIRKKYVEETPEEKVRQLILRWLLESVKIPAHRIEVEFSFSKIIPGDRDLADIVVWDFSNKEINNKQPYLLVECKRPKIKLDETTQNQVQRYLTKITPLFIIVTNGEDMLLFKLNSDKYVSVSDFN